MSSSQVLTAEELADRRYPTDVIISNDGRLVAFVVQPMGKPEEHDLTEIWLARDGKPAQQFTSGLAGDACPAFSPDSTRLAFLSDRHERKKLRVYLLPLDGGERTRISTIEGKLSNLTWSPDGSHLGVLVTDPETDDEKKKTEERNDPILENQKLKYTRLWVINAETGSARQLTFGNRSVQEYGWSRDGRTLVVATSQRTDVEAEFREIDVALVAAPGGRLRQLATVTGVPTNFVFVELAEEEHIAMRFNGFAAD